jgi:hypothetical protein
MAMPRCNYYRFRKPYFGDWTFSKFGSDRQPVPDGASEDWREDPIDSCFHVATGLQPDDGSDPQSGITQQFCGSLEICSRMQDKTVGSAWTEPKIWTLPAIPSRKKCDNHATKLQIGNLIRINGDILFFASWMKKSQQNVCVLRLVPNTFGQAIMKKWVSGQFTSAIVLSKSAPSLSGSRSS